MHRGAVHDEADFTQNQQLRQQQESFLNGPSVGSLGVAVLDHIEEDDLTAGTGAQLDVGADVLTCSDVFVAGLQVHL